MPPALPLRRDAGEADAGLARLEAERLAERGVREVLPGEPGAGEAAPVALRRPLEELREDGRGQRGVGVARPAGDEAGHAALRDHDLRLAEAVGAGADLEGQEARLREAVPPGAHLAQGARVGVEEAGALPAQDGDVALAGGPLGERQRLEALPERGVVHGDESERALLVHELDPRHAARLGPELLRLDQQVVPEGGRGHEDPLPRHHEAGHRARPRGLLLPGRAPVPVLAGDADADDAGAEVAVGGGDGDGRGRRRRGRDRGRGAGARGAATRAGALAQADPRRRGEDERRAARACGRAGSHTASGSPGGRPRPARGRGPRCRRRPRTRCGGSARGSRRTPPPRRRASGWAGR